MGTTKLRRLEENLGVADVELTLEDVRAMESASSNIKLEGARYPEFHKIHSKPDQRRPLEAPRSILLSRLALLVGLGVIGTAQTEHISAFTGTWRLNLSKSKFDPGPPFKSFTLTFTPDGARHLDLVEAAGQALKVSLPWSDGKEVTPVGQGMASTRVISKTHGKTVEDTWRRDGTIIERVYGNVSSDGKTLTMNVEGPDMHGGTFHNRVVFDKK